MELFDGGETHLRLLTAEFAFPKSGRLFTSHLGARRGTNNRAGSLGLGTSLPFRSTIVGDERIDLCPHRDSPHEITMGPDGADDISAATTHVLAGVIWRQWPAGH